MKKIGIIIFLSLLIILSWCSIDFNDEKDNKITSLENKIKELKEDKKNDLFKKKQECIKYKDEMLKFAKEYDSAIFALSEIFYSDITKSCYFISNQWFWENIVFDYLNLTYIISQWLDENCFKYDIKQNQIDCFNREWETKRKFTKKVSELKWE